MVGRKEDSEGRRIYIGSYTTFRLRAITGSKRGPMTVFLKRLLEAFLNATLVPMRETMYVKYVHIRCAASPNL